jgi:hypothetical protein
MVPGELFPPRAFICPKGNKKFFRGPDATRAIFQKSPLAAGGTMHLGISSRMQD